ncbi:S41 family peptidase [Acetivibrio ethanolgignens]|uniref:Tail specific protease domain-containing protein n=1 Tax=Acetivibrio ethanolgignens TaxID=290052 RepID=A0A0V8QD23_9FIRM|nr:S41 family peptidase [Acetivibrio ethanolgignens]KSV58291.1 hypothetical protein ASU35_13370 [Acetivibrio ethanolgignens]
MKRKEGERMEMKVKKAIILAVVAAVIAIGATAVKVENEKRAERMEKGVGAVLSPMSHALTKKYMYEDYDAFWKNAEENYPFWRVAEETTGNDLEEIKKEYRKEIEEIENDWQFNDLIAKCIDAFGGAGHMQPISSYGYRMNMVSVDLGYSTRESSHIQYLTERMNTEKSRTFYLYDKEKDTKLFKKMLKEEEGEENFTYKEYSEYKAGVIAIPGFYNARVNAAALQERFKAMEKEGIENCIIDIRGNGGGNDDYWIDGIVEPNLMKTATVDYYCLYKGKESEAYAKVCSGIKKADKSDISSLPKLDREEFEEAQYVGKVRQEIKKTNNPLFTGRFFVLTDGLNYSSAESFVRFCKETGFATLIGNTTGGDGAGYNPLYFVLPNSGICYRFSVFNFINPDGSNNEEFGTEPDIKVENQDILEACFKYLKEF